MRIAVVRQVLKIRFLQAYRIASELGIFRFLFMVCVVIIIFAFIFNQFQYPINGLVTTVICIALILMIHTLRKDHIFLSFISNNPQHIYLAEYTILTLPLTGLTLATWRPELSLLLLTGITMISFSNSKIKHQLHKPNKLLLSLIPYQCFEIRSGLRQHFFFLFPLNILGLILGFWPGTAPIILILNTLVFSGFYLHGEPRNLLDIRELTPKKMIFHKLRSNLMVFVLFQLPVSMVCIFFNPHTYLLILLIFIISLLLTVFSILLKYATYKPNTDLRANSIISGLMIIMLPALIIMLPLYYYKAIHHLKPYLDDYH
ncbi:MAG: hypothetical protein AB9842_06045 [Bacteroidales bacterium]